MALRRVALLTPIVFVCCSNLGGLVSVTVGALIGGAMGVGTDPGRYGALGPLIGVTTALAVFPIVLLFLVPSSLNGHSRTNNQCMSSVHALHDGSGRGIVRTPMPDTADSVARDGVDVHNPVVAEVELVETDYKHGCVAVADTEEVDT